MTEFFARIPALRELAASSPPPDTTDLLAGLQLDAALLDVFLDAVSHPDWLSALDAAGIFSCPPPPDVQLNGVSFRPWSASRCLARLAKVHANRRHRISEIALRIPETSNVWVVADLVAVFSEGLGPVAVAVVPTLIRALRSDFGVMDPAGIAKLASELAHAGHLDGALELLRVLLEVAPPDNPTWGRVKAKNAVRLRRGDTWEYGQCLAVAVPQLASESANRTAELLVGLLTDAVAFSQGSEKRPPGQDHSEIWLRDLRKPDHPELDLRVMLARSLRSVVLDTLTAHDPAAAAAVLAVLRAGQLPLLRRIEMDALAHVGSGHVEAKVSVLSNSEFITDNEVRREYVQLAVHSLPLLDPAARSAYLEQLTDLTAGLVRQGDEDDVISEAPSVRFQKSCVFKLLQAIETWLTPELRAFVDTNARNFSDSAAADDEDDGFRELGIESPLPPEDLAGKPIDDLLAYLRTWTPNPVDMFGPSRQGLAEKLKPQIEAKWADISASADQWIGLHPVYVNALFSVASGPAMAATPPAAWPELCKLATWAVNQPCESLTETWKPNDNIDLRRWIRVAVCRWLQAALDVEGKNLPVDLANSAWAVIDIVLGDDDPPPDSEADLADVERNHFDRAFSTTRGVALEAAFEYAKWSWYRQGRLDASTNHETALLDTLPAVKAALERCLDPTAPRAVSLHAIFGQRLDQLMALDQEWTSRVLPLILPQGGTAIDTARRRAAWEGYTLYSRPTRRTFRLLREEYHGAVGRLTPDGQLGPHQRKSAEYLADHVLSFYVNSLLELDEGTLPLLFERAPLAIRTEALRKMGQALPRSPGAGGKQWPDAPAIERILALWKWRLGRLELTDQADDAKAELAAFAPWFSATTLPADWRLGQLLQLLEHGVAIDLHSDGTKELVNLAAVDLKSTLRCMEQLLGGAAGRWLLSAKDESVPKFFEVIAQSRSAEDLTHALRILDQAGRNGALWLLPVSQKVRAALDGVGR